MRSQRLLLRPSTILNPKKISMTDNYGQSKIDYNFLTDVRTQLLTPHKKRMYTPFCVDNEVSLVPL